MGLDTQEDESEHSFSNEDYGEGDWGVVTFRDTRIHRSITLSRAAEKMHSLTTMYKVGFLSFWTNTIRLA